MLCISSVWKYTRWLSHSLKTREGVVRCVNRDCVKLLVVVVFSGYSGAAAAQTYVNFESPQTHAIDMSPDGSMLVVVNTPENRLGIFDFTPARIRHQGSVVTGLDPVSVQMFGNTTAWVVNHISDSISIVDLTTMRVVETIRANDEPHDVIFAGTPTRAFASISQRNRIDVYDPSSPSSPIAQLSIEGMVGGTDLGLLLCEWGSINPASDLNNDGFVDGADLGSMLGSWGPCGIQHDDRTARLK